MNSATYRRKHDGVSGNSKGFESAPQVQSWPADNLSSDLSQRPQTSITSSHSEIKIELAHVWLTPRLAFGLEGDGAGPTHNFKRRLSAQILPASSFELIATIGSGAAVNTIKRRATFQEIEITTWQKN
ncbi:MAG TPA: hypothetical protein VJS64_03770 [Pyrinomonadaceae bacterium]|nr:hypothetical protein [Pyrinomonadaceae bacterium]